MRVNEDNSDWSGAPCRDGNGTQSVSITGGLNRPFNLSSDAHGS